jgi:hypothetical protein
MKEHPIPQDITNYRFHIVGSMTLKQFGECAAGVIIAFIIYQTNLLAIIKWPLIILFAGGGFAAAFVPIEERPLSHWISTFISILYKPTQFFWKRIYNIPAPFLYQGNQENTLNLEELDLTPARRERIKEFISSTTKEDDRYGYSVDERQYMSNIMDIFQTQVVQQVTISQQQPDESEKPNLTVRVRSMRQAQYTTEEVIPEADRISMNSLGGSDDDANTYVIDPEYKHSMANKKDAYLDTQQVAQSIQIPEIKRVEVQKPMNEEEVASLVHQQTVQAEERAFIEAKAPQAEEVSTTDAAQFNASLPFPSKPTTPNKLVGMILTPKNELVPGAIVEIKTAAGHVSRAVKSNALGQFFITTPLDNGDYVVSVEKDNFTFRPLTISLTGKIVEPIEIRST